MQQPHAWIYRLARLVALGFPVSTALSPSFALAQKKLATAIDARLDTPPFNRQFWGVALVDDAGRVVYARNADRLFIPASNTKLIVTAVAAALLPPDFRVKTSLYADGPLVAGVVQGDLVLYGRGDPTFSHRCYAVDTTLTGVCDLDPSERFRNLADSLKARGVRTVAGDLIGDGSYFEPLTVHPGWDVYDVNWWYAAPVSGLGFNDNSVDFTWAPGSAEGAPASVLLEPNLGDIALENRTVTGPAGSITDVDFFREPGTLNMWVQGGVALDSKGGVESFALPDPGLYAARALRRALADAGISIRGTTRSTTDSLRYRLARQTPALAEVDSRPLRDWIFPILNTSQNWFAEMLLKQLGRQFGKAGSWDEGIAVERRFLIDSMKVDSTQFSLSDGSGLSGVNLISPLAFTQVLRFIRHHPGYGTFVAGLPLSGSVGSLRNRFLATPLEGKVRAKTGSIGRVNTLSGFIELDGGKTLTFSVEANHHVQSGRAMIAQIDSVVVQMGTGGSRTR